MKEPSKSFRVGRIRLNFQQSKQYHEEAKAREVARTDELK